MSVYIARIGKPLKIGFSTNVAQRMKAFETTSVDVELLLDFPGDIALERRIHNLLSELRIHPEHELFHKDWRIFTFMSYVRDGGVERGLEFLKKTTPEARKKAQEEERRFRVKAARLSKAEKDAYFASLVASRKQRIGW